MTTPSVTKGKASSTSKSKTPRALALAASLVGIAAGTLTIAGAVRRCSQVQLATLEFRAEDRAPLERHRLRLWDGVVLDVFDGAVLLGKSYIGTEAVLFCLESSGVFSVESWRGVVPEPLRGKAVIELDRCCK